MTLALPFSAVIQNMSVDKCVDMCTERVRRRLHFFLRGGGYLCPGARRDAGYLFQEKSLAVLSGDRCHCGYPSPLFSLHEPESEEACVHRCQGEEFENCGNEEYFVVYQTQVQGNNQPPTSFYETFRCEAGIWCTHSGMHAGKSLSAPSVQYLMLQLLSSMSTVVDNLPLMHFSHFMSLNWIIAV